MVFLLGCFYTYYYITILLKQQKYGIVNTVGNETVITQLTKADNLKITYQGTDAIDTDNMELKEETSTTFTVENDRIGNLTVH